MTGERREVAQVKDQGKGQGGGGRVRGEPAGELLYGSQARGRTPARTHLYSCGEGPPACAATAASSRAYAGARASVSSDTFQEERAAPAPDMSPPYLVGHIHD